MSLRTATSLAAVFLAVLMPGMAAAATTTHLAAQRVDSDSFDNYDFASQSVSSSNVEWPVTLLFTNNAEVDKIKNSLAYSCGSWPCVTPEYGRLDNSFGWFFDQDSGRKTATCGPTATTHYRLYADAGHGDHNWAPSIGYYVIGTTHRDVNECGGVGSKHFCCSDPAENEIASVARGLTNWSVYGNNWNMRNPEADRYEGDHHWSNDGLATLFVLP